MLAEELTCRLINKNAQVFLRVSCQAFTNFVNELPVCVFVSVFIHFHREGFFRLPNI